MSDPQGRPSLQDYVTDREARLFHVGRLDTDTEGLLLLTNDGELAHRLCAPVVRGRQDLPRRGRRARSPATWASGCKAGVELDDGLGARRPLPDREHLSRARRWSRCRCTRAASTSCAGCWTRSATRQPAGPHRCRPGPLGNLKPGKLRRLSQHEVGALFAAVDL